jgi:hypothetical protein
VKWGVGLVTFCVRRLPADGTPVLKDVEVIVMNCIYDLYFIVFYERAFVGQCIEYTNMHGMR